MAMADSAPWIGLAGFAALAGFLLIQTIRLRVSSRRRKASLSRFEIAIRASNGVIWDWDLPTSSMKFFGNTPAFFPGADLADGPWSFADLLERVHPDDRRSVAAFGDPAGLPDSAILEVRMLSFPPDGALGAPEDYVKWVRIEGSIVGRNKEGAPSRIAGSIVDITRLKNNERALRASLRQKEEFLHEIHHRVKNNLQLMLSILNLQEAGVRSEEAVSALREAKGRIHAISLIQDKLYDRREGSVAEFAGYLEQLFDRARALHKTELASFALEPSAIQGAVDLEVILPISIAVNEAFSNSLLHGAGPSGACEVRAVLERDGAMLSLLIEDRGPGIDPGARRGLGLDLMESLVASVRGTFEILPKPGARIRMRFPASLK